VTGLHDILSQNKAATFEYDILSQITFKKNILSQNKGATEKAAFPVLALPTRTRPEFQKLSDGLVRASAIIIVSTSYIVS
jgi:hypothetical protein